MRTSTTVCCASIPILKPTIGKRANYNVQVQASTKLHTAYRLHIYCSFIILVYAFFSFTSASLLYLFLCRCLFQCRFVMNLVYTMTIQNAALLASFSYVWFGSGVLSPVVHDPPVPHHFLLFSCCLFGVIFYCIQHC